MLRLGRVKRASPGLKLPGQTLALRRFLRHPTAWPRLFPSCSTRPCVTSRIWRRRAPNGWRFIPKPWRRSVRPSAGKTPPSLRARRPGAWGSFRHHPRPRLPPRRLPFRFGRRFLFPRRFRMSRQGSSHPRALLAGLIRRPDRPKTRPWRCRPFRIEPWSAKSVPTWFVPAPRSFSASEVWKPN